MVTVYNSRWIFISVIYSVCYFCLLNAEKTDAYHFCIYCISFCYLLSAVILANILHEIADEKVGRRWRFTDFISRFSGATKPSPQKSADFINRLTSPWQLSAHFPSSPWHSSLIPCNPIDQQGVFQLFCCSGTLHKCDYHSAAYIVEMEVSRYMGIDVPRGIKRQRTCGAWKQSTQKPTKNLQAKYSLNLTALNNIF